MENFKNIGIGILLVWLTIEHLYVIVDGFRSGEIKVYCRSSLSVFLAEPIRAHSLNFEPGYFWLEVLYNLGWPIALIIFISLA